MFRYATTVKLHDTDAAGLLFFGHQFKLAHDAYETMMTQIGFGFARILREDPFFIPIAHAEADFVRPLFVGDEVDIQLTVEKLGDTSFTLAYRLVNREGVEVGKVRTVHVCIDKRTQRPVSIPDDLRKRLGAI